MLGNGISISSVVRDDVRRALQEDIGTGDITADNIPAYRTAQATLTLREPAVLCGQPWFVEAFLQQDPNSAVQWFAEEGNFLAQNMRVAEITGNARAVLSAERTALNFLQTLSGTATVTKRYADLLKGSHTQLLDTRKTIPNLRAAQKYAVRLGGGTNHRIGLFDAVLIKENHIAAAGSITDAVYAIRKKYPDKFLEIEVETPAQFDEAFALSPDRILLDNYDNDLLADAVRKSRGVCTIEVSGNIDETNIEMIRKSNVDFVSVGAITKHIRAIDFSLRIHTYI